MCFIIFLDRVGHGVFKTFTQSRILSLSKDITISKSRLSYVKISTTSNKCDFLLILFFFTSNDYKSANFVLEPCNCVLSSFFYYFWREADYSMLDIAQLKLQSLVLLFRALDSVQLAFAIFLYVNIPSYILSIIFQYHNQ